MLGGVKIVWSNVLMLARICSLFLVALFLPKFFLIHLHSSSQSVISQNHSSFRLGLESLSDNFLKKLTPKGDLNFRIGLVTNQTGRDQCGKRTLDVLLDRGLKVSVMFAPEHGFEGKIKAACNVKDVKDKKSNIKIISLYKNWSTRKFDKSLLSNVDVLFFDMQDSGMRHYTYITTLFELLEAASLQNKPAVVLDRPNLLGPYMEGSLVSPKFKSSISYASIPVRYGMTVGELAIYFNKNILKKPANLHVVPMKNYNRYSYGSNGLLAHLSPNIKSISSCYGYSFLGLLGEIRPFDLGVGTSHAFQSILLPEKIKFPKKKWHELHLLLKKHGVKNNFFRCYSARKKGYCSGLKFNITNINTFSAFSTLLMVVEFFKNSRVDLIFSKNFNKAMGTDKVRKFLEGEIPKTVFVNYINQGLKGFFEKACKSDCFIYNPLPKVINLS